MSIEKTKNFVADHNYEKRGNRNLFCTLPKTVKLHICVTHVKYDLHLCSTYIIVLPGIGIGLRGGTCMLSISD